jgi:CheY-like chemotaxis protein
VNNAQEQDLARRITVVLVEDDPNDVLLIRRALERTSGEMTLIHLSDGDAAVQYLAGEGPYENRMESPTPTIMLLDIKLPRRSGFEVLTWARSQSTAAKRIPILMLTSSGQKADIDRAFELGATAYLRKPSRAKMLSELVADLKNFWIKWGEIPEV